MLYLLDTDICISVLRGIQPVCDHLIQQEPDNCGVSSVTAFELYAGARKSAAPARTLGKIEEFLTQVKPLPFDSEAARQAGTIRIQLEALGCPIGPYDLLIAGHALSLNATLTTGNLREFSRVTGLRVENWS